MKISVFISDIIMLTWKQEWDNHSVAILSLVQLAADNHSAGHYLGHRYSEQSTQTFSSESFLSSWRDSTSEFKGGM